MFLSKYGQSRILYVPVVKRAVVDFAVSADWTPAAGDVKISKDGGAFANVTNLPTALASANTGCVWVFSLTATEMQAAQIVVVVSDAATKAVEDQSFIIETYGNTSGQHEFDLDTPTVVASSVSALAANVITAAAIADGAIDAATFAAGAINAAAIAADAIGASELAADAVTEIAAGVLAGTITELAAVPGASPALKDALALIYMALRNKITTTATQTKMHNDAGAVVATASVTDDGTSFQRTEYA